MTLNELKEKIRDKASELGFDDCRFTTAEPPRTYPQFLTWIKNGSHAGMKWIASERSIVRRADIRRILPGAKSVICLATSYFQKDDKDNFSQLPRYAWSDDYHDILEIPLKQLSEFICNLTNSYCPCVYYTDSGAILERDFAARAGLGFIGKNNNLISPKLGGFIFLSLIITTFEFAPDAPSTTACGGCTKCLKACPTKALTKYYIDASKCLSYLTIEHKGDIPQKFRKFLNKKILGCDLCVEVCPWNRFSKVSKMPTMRPSQKLTNLLKNNILNTENISTITKEEFKQAFSGTALLRSKKDGILRNLAILESNKHLRETDQQKRLSHQNF